MGFYGNITNTSKTQFQFDKIYPNRYDMDNSKSTDGIYAGRFVLVEYDEVTHLDTFIRAQKKIENDIIKFYYNPTGETTFPTLLTKSTIAAPTMIYTARVETTPEGGYHAKDCIFYICTSELIEGSNEPATFEEVVNGNGVPNYTINYNIDTNAYGFGRGYDSTVWQKTYIDGVEKYIMVAELNTVVPTFDVAADAPTQRPLVPHFDAQSTDVYYKLHWQPTWGFRVKEASSQSKINSNNKEFKSSTDINNYPSDETAYHYTYSFDPNTGINKPNDKEEYNAAIFYNKAGFDKARHTYYNSNEPGHYMDSISIVPTGQSGAEYNIHDGTSATNINTDIQEMRILLPSLGNTISDIWDLIYGYNPDNRIRYRDIEWKDALNLNENQSLGGMTRDLNTVAGCINTVHDLMGMIITTKDNKYLNGDGFNKNYIYKEGNNYYRIYKYPTYTTSIIGSLNLPVRDDYKSDQEYNTAYENKLKQLEDDKVLEKNKQYYLIINDKGENKPEKALSKKSLSSLDPNDIIGYQSGYKYKFVAIPDMAGKMDTIYGLILKIKNLLEVEDFKTRDTSTIMGSINAINDIIDMFEGLVPGEFLICDSNGKVNSANWTTAQKYGYKNYSKSSMDKEESEAKENRWISLSLDEENRKIELKHVFNKEEDTETESNKNISNKDDTETIPDKKTSDEDNTTATSTGINNSSDDTLKLYTPIVDSMGHVVGKNIETVTLPFGYKSIKSNELVNEETKDLYTNIISGTKTNDATSSATLDDELSQTDASNSKDLLNINTINKWIQTKVTDDTLSIAHEIHAIKEVERAHDLNNLREEVGYHQDKITIQDTKYDTAGHVIENRKHTYTLPYGFKTITPATRSDAITNPTVNTTSIVADNTQDVLTIASANKWIRISGNNTNDTLSIGHEVHDFESGSANIIYGSGSDENNIFEVPTIKFDEAGHITMAENHTVTIPENFDKIDIAESGKNITEFYNSNSNTTTTPQIEGLPENVVTRIQADTLTDTVTFDTGNRWIQLVGDTTNDKISIYHAAPEVQNNISNVETGLNYGNSFIIPEVKYDRAGHIYGIATNTVTFPTPSLNDLTVSDSSVITGISMVNGTLEITQTNANVGTRKLAGYENRETDSDTDILNTNTINEAFRKLQDQIHGEETARTNAINALSLVSGNDNGTVAFNGTDVPVKGLGNAAYTDSSAYASANILNEATFAYGDEKNQKTIAELFGIVANLATEVATLREELTELKNKVETEHPTVTESEGT